LIDIGPLQFYLNSLQSSTSKVIRNLVEVQTQDMDRPRSRALVALSDKLNAFSKEVSTTCGRASQVFEVYNMFTGFGIFDSRTCSQAGDGAYLLEVQLFCLDLAYILQDNTFALAAMHEITHAWIDLIGLRGPMANSWQWQSYQPLAKLFRALPFSSAFLQGFRQFVLYRNVLDPNMQENKDLHKIIITSESYLFPEGWKFVEACTTMGKPELAIRVKNPVIATGLPFAKYSATMSGGDSVDPVNQTAHKMRLRHELEDLESEEKVPAVRKQPSFSDIFDSIGPTQEGERKKKARKAPEPVPNSEDKSNKRARNVLEPIQGSSQASPPKSGPVNRKPSTNNVAKQAPRTADSTLKSSKHQTAADPKRSSIKKPSSKGPLTERAT
jgi:hypothetical protein